VGRVGLEPDLGHAERLLYEAEHVAIPQGITDEGLKAVVRAGTVRRESAARAAVAQAMAATDPDRAVHLAHSTGGYHELTALAGIAKALAGIDPDRAERTAYSITDVSWKAIALASVAEG